MSPTQAFSWGPVLGAQAYYLYVGTTVGAKDVADSGEIQQTSHQPPPLPGGRVLYSRLWTKLGGAWRFVDSQFTTAPVASFITPSSGSAIASPRQTFSWTPLPGAQAYYLYVGGTVGAKDLVDSGEMTQQASYQASSLPGGRTLYARLWTKWGGAWRFVDSQFTTAPVASLITPSPGSVVSPAQTFSWATVPAAQVYYLYVGSTIGANDVVDSGEIQQASYQARPLPGGRTLYARLWTKWGNAWRFVDSQFTTAPVASLITPSAGSTVASPTQTFSWTPVASAQAYYLYVGSAVGAKDLVDSDEIQLTSYTARSSWGQGEPFSVAWDVPSDAARVAGYAMVLDNRRIDLGTILPAACLEPSDPTWCYRVPLPAQPPGRHSIAVSAYNIFGEAASPSLTFTEANRIAYVRLWTKVAGLWRYTDSYFTPVSLAAEFVYPPFGATNMDPAKPFAWTAVRGAEAYSLNVGLTRGGYDLVDLPQLYSTSYLAPRLASLSTDRMVFARLGTRIQGVWLYTETTFGILPIASLVSPPDGAIDVPTSKWFSWTASADARAYYLYVGTTPGSKNIVNSGELLGWYYQAPNLPASTRLYVRLWTKMGDLWRYVDSQFVTR